MGLFDDLGTLAKRGPLLVPKQISWRRANTLVKRQWAELYPFHERWLGRLTITDAGRRAIPPSKEGE
jgi:hypothetical protein